jgi:hypothetical protein
MATFNEQQAYKLERLRQCLEMAANARLAASHGAEAVQAIEWRCGWTDESFTNVRLGDVLAPQDHARTGLDDE